MAAYAATTILDFPKPLQLSNSPMGVLSGSCNITNYNDTVVENTTITGQFLADGQLSVVPNGVSTGGYAIRWDATSKAFRAYSTGTAADAPLNEEADDSNIGSFDFIAVGQLG